MPGPSYLVLKPNDSFGILIYLLSKDVSWFCMMIFANSFTLRVFTTKNFCLRHIFNTMSCSYPLYYYYLKMFFGSVATTIFANSFNVFALDRSLKLLSNAYFQYDVVFIPSLLLSKDVFWFCGHYHLRQQLQCLYYYKISV